MATRSELFAVARSLGHVDARVYENRRGRWMASCGCGYVSASRVNQQQALEAGVHHAVTAAQQFIASSRANGRAEFAQQLLDRAS